MSNRFLATVAAAALLAGASFAHAQGTGMGREGSSAGAGTQHGATSSERGSTAAPTYRQGAESPSGMKATQSDERSSGGARNQRAQGHETQGQNATKGMSSESEHGKPGRDMKAEGREGGKDMKTEGREGRQGKTNKAEDHEGRQGGANTKAEGREGRNGGRDMQTEGREHQRNNMNAQDRDRQGSTQNRQGGTATESRTGQTQGMESRTTGQAGAAAKLSTEQRTKITSVIREQHVEPLDSVNFSVAVGTRVPRDVRFHPLPQDVVTIYPEWRGYDFVLVHDQIIVIDPRTYEIVAVLET